LGCIPVADTITWSGNKPRFVDIDVDTYNINVDEIKKRITGRTAIVAPVHLQGLPCDLDAICEIAERNNLILIEDAAMAPGARYRGKKVGSFGDAAMFSLERSKFLTSYQGGIVTTSSDRIYNALVESKKELKKSFLYGHVNLLKLYAYHTATNPYIWRVLYFFWKQYYRQGTFNVGIAQQPMPKKYLIDYAPIQARVAIKQLRKIDSFIEKRRKNAAYLTKNLRDIEGLATPVEPSYAKHVYARYIIRIKKEFKMDRNHLIRELLNRGVDPGLWYLYSLPYTKFYQKIGDMCPNGLKASEQTLALPNYPSLSRKDIRYISDALIEISS
jgi:dTDP-4-amino-4,6-dideoxygalactose transaminase